MVQPKKIPLRRCIGCGEHFPKSELARLVRSPEGDVALDFTGKMPGRGAYICKNAACLRQARKSHRAESALECRIPEALYDRLEAQLHD